MTRRRPCSVLGSLPGERETDTESGSCCDGGVDPSLLFSMICSFMVYMLYLFLFSKLALSLLSIVISFASFLQAFALFIIKERRKVKME